MAFRIYLLFWHVLAQCAPRRNRNFSNSLNCEIPCVTYLPWEGGQISMSISGDSHINTQNTHSTFHRAHRETARNGRSGGHERHPVRRLSTVPSGTDPERELTNKFEQIWWRWARMVTVTRRHFRSIFVNGPETAVSSTKRVGI